MPMDPTTLFGVMMGTGMVSQGLFGYLGASAQANSMTAQAQIFSDARVDIAETNARASVDNTRWQVLGFMYGAQQQHNQAVQQMLYMDLADRRQALNWRLQLRNEIKEMTLAYNAQIFAWQNAHTERMAEIRNAHDEKMVELEQPETVEIDPSTLLA